MSCLVLRALGWGSDPLHHKVYLFISRCWVSILLSIYLSLPGSILPASDALDFFWPLQLFLPRISPFDRVAWYQLEEYLRLPYRRCWNCSVDTTHSYCVVYWGASVSACCFPLLGWSISECIMLVTTLRLEDRGPPMFCNTVISTDKVFPTFSDTLLTKPIYLSICALEPFLSIFFASVSFLPSLASRCWFSHVNCSIFNFILVFSLEFFACARLGIDTKPSVTNYYYCYWFFRLRKQ